MYTVYPIFRHTHKWPYRVQRMTFLRHTGLRWHGCGSVLSAVSWIWRWWNGILELIGKPLWGAWHILAFVSFSFGRRQLYNYKKVTVVCFLFCAAWWFQRCLILNPIGMMIQVDYNMLQRWLSHQMCQIWHTFLEPWPGLLVSNASLRYTQIHKESCNVKSICSPCHQVGFDLLPCEHVRLLCAYILLTHKVADLERPYEGHLWVTCRDSFDGLKSEYGLEVQAVAPMGPWIEYEKTNVSRKGKEICWVYFHNAFFEEPLDLTSPGYMMYMADWLWLIYILSYSPYFPGDGFWPCPWGPGVIYLNCASRSPMLRSARLPRKFSDACGVGPQQPRVWR